MNLRSFAKKYELLKDKDGRYYKVDKNGLKKVPWVTVNFLSINFGASRYNIKKRLTGVVNSQKISPRYGPPCDYYDLNDSLKICSELFKKIPIANSKGITIIRGQEYASIQTLSKFFKICVASIISRISHLSPEIIKGRRDRFIDAFNVELAKKACADLLQKFPCADENNIAAINGKKYASIRAIAKKNKVSQLKLGQRIKEKKLKAKKIKLKSGRIVDAHNIELADRICVKLKKIPKANKNGIAIINGESYTTIYVIAKKFKLHYSSIQRIINVNKIQSKKIEVEHGQIRDSFSVKAVEKASGNLLKRLPVANKNGIAIINGEEYATITTLAKKWDRGENYVKKMVEKYKLKSQKIKRTASTIYDAYNVREAKIACAEKPRKNI